MTPAEVAEVRAYVERTTAEQGVPFAVTDDLTLRRIAARFVTAAMSSKAKAS